MNKQHNIHIYSRYIEDYSCDNPGKVWRTYYYDMTRGADIAKYIARTRSAWPGGYELFAITDDCAVICNDCCRREFYQIAVSTNGDSWQVTAVDSMASLDSSITCDHCSRLIN